MSEITRRSTFKLLFLKKSELNGAEKADVKRIMSWTVGERL